MHDEHSHARPPGEPAESLNSVALAATVHCLTGCTIGEVAGMVIGTALMLGNAATIALSIVLAFAAGFTLTAWPFLRRGYGFKKSMQLAVAADAASIAVMEVVDNVLMLFIPGAMAAPLDSLLFWGSLALSLVVAGVAAFPVNRWLIARGLGHAAVHAHH